MVVVEMVVVALVAVAHWNEWARMMDRMDGQKNESRWLCVHVDAWVVDGAVVVVMDK